MLVTTVFCKETPNGLRHLRWGGVGETVTVLLGGDLRIQNHTLTVDGQWWIGKVET